MDDALHIVEKLEHRAGKDASGEVGDGVGILTQIPHGFFSKAAQAAGITLRLSGESGRFPQESMARESAGCQAGDYGIGMFFLPQDTLKRTFAIRMFEVIAQKECRCGNRSWERRQSTACPVSASVSWPGLWMWSGG